MEQGYIKLYRVFKEWEWYDDINTKVLFLHLLLNANYQDKKWHGIDIKRGQILTGVNELAKQTTLSEQNIRTSLNKLKLTGELTSQSTNRYSIITLNSYDKYQSTNKLDNEQLTNNQQATNKQLTTTNKEKNISIKELEEVKELWNEFAEQNNLSKIIELSSKRKTAIKQRSDETNFNLEDIFRLIEASEFLLGSTGWKIDFDWLFCSKENYLKVLEGNYNNKIAKAKKTLGEENHDRAKEYLRSQGITGIDSFNGDDVLSIQ